MILERAQNLARPLPNHYSIRSAKQASIKGK